MRLSLEISSAKLDVERVLLRYRSGAFSEAPKAAQEATSFKQPMVVQQSCSKVSVSIEASSRNAIGRVFENVML